MSKPPEAEDEETFISGVADELDRVRQGLGFPRAAGSGRNTDPSISGEQYMSRLNRELEMENHPGRSSDNSSDNEAPENPFANYIDDVAHELERSTDLLKEQLDQEYEAAKQPSGEVICCIVNGLYAILSRAGAADDVDSVRRVAEEDVRRWILLLRELLVASREVLQGGTVSQINIDISILYEDLSALIKRMIESGLAALMFMVHDLLKKLAEEVDDEVTDEIQSTRCVPLMRIWAAIYDYLFNTASGIISRTRAFLRDVIVNEARQRKKASETISLGEDAEIKKQKKYLRWVNDLIDLLDAILAALSILSICRVPRDSEEDTDRLDDAIGRPSGPTEDSPDPDYSEENPEEDQPGQDSGSPQTKSREGSPVPEAVPDGSDLTSASSGSGRDLARGSHPAGENIQTLRGERINKGDFGLVQTEDPDLGKISVLEPEPQEEDLLYFTPTNIAALMTKAFDIDPAEAIDLATNQSCRNEIEPETEEALVELGVIPTEEQ